MILRMQYLIQDCMQSSIENSEYAVFDSRISGTLTRDVRKLFDKTLECYDGLELYV